MGIRFNCPSGHKLNVKEFLAGKRGVCPQCGAKFVIPMPSEASATPQAVGVGRPQSTEHVASPSRNYQVASAAASPSIVIPVSDIELAPPEPEVQRTVAATKLPPAVLPESIVVGAPSIVTA